MLKFIMALMVASAGSACVAAETRPVSNGAATATNNEECAVRLVLLGTKGGPVVDPERSEPSSLLIIDGKTYMIDAGAGTVHRLSEAGFQPADIYRVFLTHHHLDHTAGLAPLLALNWINTGLGGSSIPTVEIYGPPATESLVSAALEVLAPSERIFTGGIPALPPAKDRFIGHDMQPGLIYSDERVTVTAIENTHFSHPTSGPDGVRDMSFSYRFDTDRGSIVFTGDTGPSDAVTALAKDADILVSEVLNPSRGLQRPDNPRATDGDLAEHMTLEHLSAAEVGRMAAAANVGKVVLVHIPGTLSEDGQATILADIRRSYTGPVIFGTDLLSLTPFATGRH